MSSELSVTKKSGLQFNVEKIHKMVEKVYPSDVNIGSSVYLSAVLEYICAEILELGGNLQPTTVETDSKRITPYVIQRCIRADSELNTLFPPSVTKRIFNKVVHKESIFEIKKSMGERKKFIEDLKQTKSKVTGDLIVFDVLVCIFQFLSPLELVEVAYVSKLWRKVIFLKGPCPIVSSIRFKDIFKKITKSLDRKFRSLSYNQQRENQEVYTQRKSDCYHRLLLYFGGTLNELELIEEPTFSPVGCVSCEKIELTGVFCPNLRKINLQRCCFSTLFFDCLGSACGEHLEEISFGFEREYEVNMIGLFRSVPNLRILKLCTYCTPWADTNWNLDVDDIAITALAGKCSKLEVLSLSLLPRIRDLSFAVLIRKNPNLNTIELKFAEWAIGGEGMFFERDGLKETVKEILKLKKLKKLKLPEKLTSKEHKKELEEKFIDCEMELDCPIYPKDE